MRGHRRRHILGASQRRRNPHGHGRRAILYENLEEKMHMDMSEEPFGVESYKKNVRKLTGNMPAPPSGDHILDGHLGTCYKSHFGWKFTGKVPDPDSGQGILREKLQEKKHIDISEEPFCVEI